MCVPLIDYVTDRLVADLRRAQDRRSTADGTHLSEKRLIGQNLRQGVTLMDYKKVSLGLGFFSIGLGLVEVAAPGRLSRWLGVGNKGARRVIALFGARELVAGAMLLRGPAVSTNMWNRVFGDAMDLAALGVAFTRSDRRPAVTGALGFVAGAALLDAVTARGLARQTGRTFPSAERAPA
jgi:hypothetical protein